MIPKKIHYCWFGKGEKSDRIKHCIDSWKKYLPEYEIVEWNEDNFDINICDFTKKAYEEKKWAYVSDVARFFVLYNEGGIYMDTDVEVYDKLDRFLDCGGFIGFESQHYLSTATIGSEKGNPVIKLLLDYYKCIDFKLYPVWTDYIKYEETSPCIVTNLMSLLGVDRDKDVCQTIKHFEIYPRSYFFTKDEGYTYHSFSGSW